MFLIDIELCLGKTRVAIVHTGEVAETDQLDGVVKTATSSGGPGTYRRHIVVDSLYVGRVFVEEETYSLVSPIR